MPKHEISIKKPEKDRNKYKTHPIWQGIGCILIVLIPIISYAASTLLIENRNKISWLLVPSDIVFTNFKDPYIIVKITYAAVIMFVLALFFTLITFLINRFFGPPRFGPYDVKQ